LRQRLGHLISRSNDVSEILSRPLQLQANNFSVRKRKERLRWDVRIINRQDSAIDLFLTDNSLSRKTSAGCIRARCEAEGYRLGFILLFKLKWNRCGIRSPSIR